ncbi:hypothetical protein [Streptomyces sp. NPDC056160]|uniref:hypothetical protein n=1 Tax=Streptomyces sp. NPDC056160 TaxID=3345731 RepID=UPI0035D7EF0F
MASAASARVFTGARTNADARPAETREGMAAQPVMTEPADSADARRVGATTSVHWAVGDAVQLARSLRRAVDTTNVVPMPGGAD